MQSERAGSSWGLLFALVLVSLAFFLTLVRYRPPAPRPADIPTSEFSGARAREVLGRLVGDGIPHPVGTAASTQVRERVIAELSSLGYEVQVQQAFACTYWGACATVKNVLTRLPGQEAGVAVLVAAHYDSVAAGPGASDDGAGVATLLEMARNLKAAAPTRHPIIFLIDEGEEAGLLGAKAFVDEHPWATEGRMVVNVEARGTSGPSLMFETGSDSAWLMRLYARSVPHPITSSLYYDIYKRLPNDTDFTVFKASGDQGFNFAYIGNVMRYHTQLDNFAYANPGSLQHHGDNALAVTRALATADSLEAKPGEAGFFDVFAFSTVWWPVRWTLPVAVVNAGLFLFVVLALARRDSPRRVFSLIWGFVGWLGMIVASALLALGLSRLLMSLGAFPSRWVADPLPSKFAFVALGFLVPVLCTILFFSRAEFWGLWSGLWLWWALLALGLSLVAPGTSYVFLVPSLVATLAALVSLPAADRAGARAIAAALPVGFAGWMIFSVTWLLYGAVGARAYVSVAILATLLGATFLPPFVAAGKAWRWMLAIVALLGVVFGTVRAARVPAYSSSSPQRLNVVFHQDADSDKAQWLAISEQGGSLPQELKQAAQFEAAPVSVFPWSMSRAYRAAAAPVQMAPPELSGIQGTSNGGKRLVRALLRSSRGAAVVTMLFSPSTKVSSFTMQGKLLPELSSKATWWYNNWKAYSCLTMPPEGIEVSFTLEGNATPEIVVLDESPGVPPAGDALLNARPSTATPSQDGDVTIVTRHVRLSP